ncbi:MAG TPA: adenosine deaminase [Kineosporiaceae bacterium]|nr:adenosine deaminase [Kineosporiaceae bacterium]
MAKDLLINLHTHLEGRVRPGTAAELAAASGLPEPEGGWEQALQLTGPGDLTVFLAKVNATYPFFGSIDQLGRIVSEAVQDAAADGVDYLELRFGPGTHTQPGFELDDVVRAACDGAREGTRLSGLPAGVVVAALRHHPAELNLEVARVAARFAGAGVVGFDLAGDELRYPVLEPYVEPFAVARAAGLGLTCHAAEAAPGQAARDAVRLFGVSRIGHGTHVSTDPEVLRWAADSGVVIEVCPTSNWFTGAIDAIGDHPAARFARAGVPIVLGDDNPIQTGSPISAERAVLRDKLGFNAAEIADLERVSVRSAFAADSVRADLSGRLGEGGPEEP